MNRGKGCNFCHGTGLIDIAIRPNISILRDDIEFPYKPLEIKKEKRPCPYCCYYEDYIKYWKDSGLRVFV